MTESQSERPWYAWLPLIAALLWIAAVAVCVASVITDQTELLAVGVSLIGASAVLVYGAIAMSRRASRRPG